MTLETTSAFITTVGPDHTIVLPEDIAVGATVAVVLMSNPLQENGERQARFAATLAAIRAAAAETTPPPVTEAELAGVIKKARRTARS